VTLWKRWMGAALACLGLVACGGGGGGGSDEDATADDVSAVARIEVSPAALLLTAGQPAQTLTARAFDATGRELRVPIAWSSSRTAEIAVDAQGRVSAASALGAAQIVARAGSVSSSPVLATAVELAPGVQLIDDAQVVSLPVAVDPAARGLDVDVETVLSGLSTPPAVGSLLLGRQGLAIGGEVLSATPEGANVRVRLRLGLGDIRRLVARAKIDETLRPLDPALNAAPEVTELYDVAQVGDEFVFTPKPGVTGFEPQRRGVAGTSAGGRGGRTVRPLAIDPVPPLVKHRLGPFECEIAEPILPINLSNPGGFTIKFEPVYTLQYDENDGLRKLELGASASFKWKGAVAINAGALFNVTCEATLLRRLMPLPGWAGLIFSGEVKAGFGFEAEGSITMPLLGAEAQAELSGVMSAGLDCAAGECTSFGRFEPSTKSGWRLITPDDALGNLRSELFFFPYGFAGLKAGATLIEQMRIEVFSIRAGLKAEAALAPEDTQMTAPVLPGFPDYRSSYKIGLLGEVAAGSLNKGKTDLQALLQRLGFFKANLLKLQLAKTLAESPKATVTMDRQGVRSGEVVNFRVRLDPALAYLTLPLVDNPTDRAYNIQRIRIVRSGALETTRTVATVLAVPDQMEFELSWLADGVIDEAGGQFAAFVDTLIPLPVGLKLGPAVLSTQKVVMHATVDGSTGPRIGGLGTASVTAVPQDAVRVDRLTGNNSFGALLSPDAEWILYNKRSLVDLRTVGEDLFLVRVADGTTTQLTRPEKINSRAAWSPQSDAFVYSAMTPASNLQGAIDIRIRRLADGSETTLMTFPPENRGANPVDQLSWSPDGSRIALVIERPEDQRSQPGLFEKDVMVMRPDGSDRRLLLTAEIDDRSHLDWSADSRQIVLVDQVRLPDGSPQSRLALLDVETGTRRTLTSPVSGLGSAGFDFFLDTQPRFSPDGASVAYLRSFSTFTSPSRDDGAGLRVVRIDGGADRRLSDRPVSTLQGWTNEGDAVIATGLLDDGRTQRVLRVPMTGSVSEAMPFPALIGHALQRARTFSTDLAVEIVGGNRHEPGDLFTLALNMRNLTAIEAREVRLDFDVPPEWEITQLTGATGCSRSLNSMTCRLDSMTRDTPRAVLVEVRAPQLRGEHQLIARVSSFQTDSAPANNAATMAVQIGSPP
jgi:hypothetical protein